MEDKILEVRNLTVTFFKPRGFFGRKSEPFTAVNNVSFSVSRGDILGIAGESGSGKSTLCRTILNLTRFIAPDAVTEGDIFYYSNGEPVNILRTDKRYMRRLRKEIQMVFQDPYSSLNPRMNVFETISEPFDIHFKGISKKEKYDKVISILSKVGLSDEYLSRYPHEFSGGQRQRIAIARALAPGPRLLAADEPVSALDVSIQADIINLLLQLRKDSDITYLLVTHDLSILRHVSNRIIVMYLGNIVESGDTAEVCRNPSHPYTRRLLESVPEIGKKPGFQKYL